MRTICFVVSLLFAGASFSYAQKIGCTTSMHLGPAGETPRISSFDTLVTPGSRGLADNYYLWDNGATIKVKFLSGSKALQEKVKMYAREWEKYANIKLDFVSSGPTNLRILLGTGKGHNSLVGVMNNLMPDNMQTMNLDTADLVIEEDLKGTVQHEFGHALGLLHEHSSPIAGIKWNKDLMYANYAKVGWDKDKVDAQIFKTYSISYTNGTSYDNKSIMHYSIDSWETLDGYTVKANNEISAGDKMLMAALYPPAGSRKNEVPRFEITNYGKLEGKKDDIRQGYAFFPSFDIRAAGATGKVYFCILFLDKDGFGVEDKDGNYAYGRTVASTVTITMPGGSNASFNKNGARNAEMFIPASEIHLPSGEHDVYLLFRSVHVTQDGEIKFIYESDPVPFRLVK